MRAALWRSVDLSITFYHERGRVSMTNEELAKEIQSGDRDKLLDLWAQVKRFAHNWAYKWTVALNGRGGLSVDDFEQAAFLALLEALEGWRSEGGAFLTWYGLKLKGAFSEAAGLRTQRARRDPLQNCISLDAPITDSEGDTLSLADVLPDPEAEQVIENIAECDLRYALHRALLTLSEPQRRAVVLRCCYGFTLDETAVRMGTTRTTARSAEQKGLRLLRHPRNSQRLRIYR